MWLTAERFHVAEGLWRQRNLGLLGAETMRPFERFLGQLLSSPIVAKWWDSEIDVLSEEFREYVDVLRLRDTDQNYGNRVRNLRDERVSS